MSKAVLVIDMPDSCKDCPCYKGGNLLRCGVDLSQLTDKEIREKPHWCPIRPLPEKRPLQGDVSDLQKMLEEMRAASWNACIDEILGK